ncbi:MAG: CDP-alcohol phosphatidyltransferase family protein [Desulfobacteraceae bacterium]
MKHFHLIYAWSAHVFTTSGVCFLFLSLIAAVDGHFKLAFLYLAVSTLIDALDGFFSRKANVKKHVPGIDGELLDNIIDYTGFVFVPAFIIYKLNLIPGFFGLAACFIILTTSCYQFCQKDAKTKDHYFKGFPSYWNIVALYLFLYQAHPFTGFFIILLCGVLVFIPVKYLYPSRTKFFQKPILVMGTLWGAGIFIVLLLNDIGHPPVWFSLVSTAFFAAYTGASLVATFKKTPAEKFLP